MSDTSRFSDALRWAYDMATYSPDPSTQNGAVLCREDGSMVSCTLACNEFPGGVEYLPERWERPLKYALVEHAERNAIFQAARNGVATRYLTLVCPWAACADCARAIIQAGIVRLVRRGNNETNLRWDESIAVADRMLNEAGIDLCDLHDSFPNCDPILRDGKMFQP